MKKRSRSKSRGSKSKREIMTHNLVSSGGQGCIFRPAIKCKSKKKNKNRSRNKKRLSKISFHKKSSDREFTMDEVVRLIPGHDQWAILWDEYCDSPPYRFLKSHTDIDDCFRKHPQKHSSGTTFPMLVGDYGGLSLSAYGDKHLTKKTFATQKAFDAFLKPLSSMISKLHIGIQSLQEHNISHGDLSIRNVVISKGTMRMIDFGMASRKSDLDYLKSRIKFVGSLDKCYDPYPYEYIIQGLSKSDLKKEISRLKEGDYRDGYEDYLSFHKLLGDKDRDKRVIQYLSSLIDGSQKRSSVEKIFEYLDIYSLGLLLPNLIHDIGISIGIDFEMIYERCKQTPYLDKSLEYSQVFDI